MSALPSSIARTIGAPAIGPLAERGIGGLADIFPAGVRELPDGTDILKRGNRSPDVFMLRRGWTFTYRILPDGRRQILHFALPDEILNYGAGSSGLATESIQTLSHAAVSAMPREQLNAAARLTPEIGHKLAAQLECNRLLAYEHMTNIGRRSARERIANLLLELFCRVHHRPPDAPHDTASMPLTQNVIADALGLTSVHVNRTLRNLRDEGIAQMRHGALLVLDPERFIELADLSGELFILITHADGRDAPPTRVR